MVPLFHQRFVCVATPLGVITVPGDSDLETCRLFIEHLQNHLDQVDGMSPSRVAGLGSADISDSALRTVRT